MPQEEIQNPTSKLAFLCQIPFPMAMSRLMSLIIPSRPFNLFGDGKPNSRRDRRTDPDVFAPLPIAQIDFAGRIPLTRPSSPRPVTVPENDVGSKSPLDRLPLEIRHQIWEDVVAGGRTFHLAIVEVQHERRLRASECLSPNPGTCDGSCRRLGGPMASAVKSSKKLLLPLLLTSRKIYSEAIHYLYSSNIFETHDADVLELLPLLLLPQRINDIRSLIFTWRFQRYSPRRRHVHPEVLSKKDQDKREASWTSIWNLIASMQNLQTLHVKLDVRDLWWGPDRLEPIRKVTRPETFILDLPFPPGVTSHSQVNSESTDKSLQGADCWAELPCTIRRVSPDSFYEH